MTNVGSDVENDVIKDYMVDEPKEQTDRDVKDVEDVEEKRESLAILASLGETKTYVGKEMSLGDVTKLEPKEVDKYCKRYQAVSSKQVSGTLILGGIRTVSRVVSYFLPIDNPDLLCKDLEQDKLVQCELASLAGLLVLRGGRFVALASALFQIANHVEFASGSVCDHGAGGTKKDAGTMEQVVDDSLDTTL